MAKDARALREEAAEAAAQGKHKRALAAYLELERVEPQDAQWAKRAGETYRKLGNNKHAIEAFNRAAERYAQNGLLVQAIAVCKLVLQIDPQHADTLRRLATINERANAGPTRAGSMAENNPSLHDNPNVTGLIRRPVGVTGMTNAQNLYPGRTTTPPAVAVPRTKTSAPPLNVPRTKSKPITLSPGAALESVQLSKQVADSVLRESSQPGVHLIPIDDAIPQAVEDPLEAAHDDAYYDEERPSTPVIEIEMPDSAPIETEIDDVSELELEDIEEIPLPEPRAIGQAAQRALAATPLFAGLPSDTLEALVEHLALVSLDLGEHLFREGDPSDALYVIVEGEVSLQTEGPPRTEISRLGPGSFLGEVALMTDQPRSVTASAVAPSELLRIDRTTLANVLGNHGDMLHAILRFIRDRIVERWIRTSPLFRPFDDTQRAELAARFTFLEIDAGTKLLGAGARPDGLYIVLAGQFIVVRGGQTIATLVPGDLIGETALLSGGAFRSDVIAKNRSLALCLPAADFREVIMTHPHVLEYIGEQAEHSRRLQIL